MKEGILKKIRSNRQIPQKKFAQDIGISQQTVASWEIGRTEPSNLLLVKIAEYFKVSTDYLLGFNAANSRHSLSKEQLNLLEGYDSLGTDGKSLLRCLLTSLLVSHSNKTPKVIQSNNGGDNFLNVGGGISYVTNM